MNIKLAKMLQDDEIMPVAFVIPEENILASSRVIVFPINLCILNSGKRRMLVIFKAYSELLKKLI
jgi:hypothetical protein